MVRLAFRLRPPLDVLKALVRQSWGPLAVEVSTTQVLPNIYDNQISRGRKMDVAQQPSMPIKMVSLLFYRGPKILSLTYLGGIPSPSYPILPIHP